jgi:hypothetical protein
MRWIAFEILFGGFLSIASFGVWAIDPVEYSLARCICVAAELNRPSYDVLAERPRR